MSQTPYKINYQGLVHIQYASVVVKQADVAVILLEIEERNIVCTATGSDEDVPLICLETCDEDGMHTDIGFPDYVGWRVFASTSKNLAEVCLYKPNVQLNMSNEPLVTALPTESLLPSEVVQRGHFATLEALEKADEYNQVYGILDKDRGVSYPAWQFVDPVPSMLHGVVWQNSLACTHNIPGMQLHTFFVTAADELNELSPAEVLAGKPFVGRTDIEVCQQRILDLEQNERLIRVRRLLEIAKREASA